MKKRVSDNNYDNRVNEALQLKNSGNLEESLKKFIELKNEYPEDFLTYIIIGLIFWDLNNLKEASESFKKAIEFRPNSEKASIGYFHTLWDQKKYIEALDEMKRFLTNNKSNEYTEILNEMNENDYCILAEAYLQKNRYEDAEKACQRAINIDSNCEEAYYLLGEIARHTSKIDAINYYRYAIKIAPKYQEAWGALGRELIASIETRDEGIQCLQKAIALDTEDGWSYLYLANALWKKGEIDKADNAYKKAIEVFPDYSEVYKWYAEFLNSQGRLSEAKAVIKKFKKLK